MVMEVPSPGAGHGDGPLCGARKRQGEGTCRNPAGFKTDHAGIGACHLHGGKTVSHRTAARREIAVREVRRLGLVVYTTPHDALHEELGRSLGAVGAIEDAMRFSAAGDGLVVDADALTATEADEGPAMLVRETIYREAGGEVRVKPNPLIAVWTEQRRHLADVAAAAHRAGVEDRILARDQEISDYIARILHAALPALGVNMSPPMFETVADAVASAMRQVADETGAA